MSATLETVVCCLQCEQDMDGPPLPLEDETFPSMEDACLVKTPLCASGDEDAPLVLAEETPIEVERASCAASAAETVRKRWLLGDFCDSTMALHESQTTIQLLPPSDFFVVASRVQRLHF